MARPAQVQAFGTLLKEWREGVGLSLEGVVQRLKKKHGLVVTRGGLSRIELGQTASPDPLWLLALADIYQCPLSGMLAVLKRNRETTVLPLDEARQIAADHNDGPSPAVAKEALIRAQVHLLRIATDLDELVNANLKPQPWGQTTTPRRRKTDEIKDDRKTR